MRFFALATYIVLSSAACSQKAVNDFSYEAGEVGRSIADSAAEAYQSMISGFEKSERPVDATEQQDPEQTHSTNTPQQPESDSTYSGGYVESPGSSSEEYEDEQDDMYY